MAASSREWDYEKVQWNTRVKRLLLIIQEIQSRTKIKNTSSMFTCGLFYISKQLYVYYQRKLL